MTPDTSPRAQLLAWLPVALGLAVLYVPSLYDLLTGIWSSDEQMHGPIVHIRGALISAAKSREGP